ncbi:hypothetical protein ACFL2Y_04800 [Candidatus Omnitrophota bacterium]
MDTPDGGESWLTGDTQNITWTRKGPIANIRIQYSIDGGSNYPDSPLLENNPIYPTVDATGLPEGSNSYSVPWVIPDELSGNVRIKITDVTDETVFDESEDIFVIKGQIVIDYPTGSEVFEVDELETIQWTTTGTFDNVKIEYSTNDGGSYNPIAGAESLPASQGSTGYDWTVYDAVSDTVRIKVSNVGTEPVDAGVSNQIAIKPKLTLTAPTAGVTWMVGSTDHDIEWTKSGTINTVKLEYLVDGGTPIAIDSDIDATGVPPGEYKYPWTIPDNISDQVVVKITDTTDPDVYDDSEEFEIAGWLELTAPNGSEVWVVDQQEAITWVRHGNSISQVKLSYTISDGADNYDKTINSGLPIDVSTDNGSYTWTIPDAIGTDLKVKIEDPNSAATTPDTSDNLFVIRGSLEITSPISTSDWEIATTEDITWDLHGSIDNVKLDYLIDSGSTYSYTIESSIDATGVPADSYTYSWSIPDQVNMISNSARVKITNVDDPTFVFDESADFSLRGRFAITFPTEGYRWVVGDTQWITWTTYGEDITDVVLEYSTDNGTPGSWKFITQGSIANNDLKDWTVPDQPGILSIEALIKVSDQADPDTYANSPLFSIHGNLVLGYPNGGQIFDINSSETITWTVDGPIDVVKLEYSTNDGGSWYSITDSTNASDPSEYTWSPIPDETSTKCFVRITDVNDLSVTDVSDFTFSIKGALTIDRPDGNEDFTVYDATHNDNKEEIKWLTAGGISKVDLFYSTESGIWIDITPAEGIANNANTYTSYMWEVPNAICDTARVRVMDHDDTTVWDDSNSDFNIIGKLKVVIPDEEGVQWKVNNPQTIEWYSVGTIQSVDLYYRNSLGSYLLVKTTPGSINGSAGTNNYIWTIPDVANINTTNSVIRVVNNINPAIWDESDNVFAIQASFNVTQPSTGAWLAGDTEQIIWTTGGTVTDVRLRYSIDGGSSFEFIQGADSVGSNDGEFA